MEKPTFEESIERLADWFHFRKLFRTYETCHKMARRILEGERDMVSED